METNRVNLNSTVIDINGNVNHKHPLSGKEMIISDQAGKNLKGDPENTNTNLKGRIQKSILDQVLEDKKVNP